MRKILSIILLLGFVQISYGRFSKFVHVTPSTELEYKPNISITPDENNLYTIEFPWEKQSKQCWLIIFNDAKAPNGNLDFRQIIWKEKKIPEGISQIIPLRRNQDGCIEVKITKEVMTRSYISIDFPRPVMDGGYYYTIDLPSYVVSIEKQISNQSIEAIVTTPVD